MLKLLVKILILSLIVLGINYLIYEPLASFSWGDENIHNKRLFLEEKRNNINTLFLGSSRINAQIDPDIFDEQTEGIKSFNYGINGLTPPLSYYLLEHIIDMPEKKLKYIIIEMNDISRAADLHTLRTKYWYTAAYYCFAVRAFLNSGYSYNIKLDAFKNHTISFAEKILNIGMLEKLIEYHNKTFHPNHLFAANMGYCPLDSLLINSKDSSERITLAKIKKELQRDSTKLYENRIVSSEQFTNIDKDECNDVHLAKINELISKAKSKGITLIFLLAPRIIESKYREILPVFFRIDKKHRIELSDSRKYPQFYIRDLSFDKYHLNTEGSKLFTILLAEKFNELVNESGYE